MINVKVDDPNLVPVKKHITDAGWDLKSTEDHVVRYLEKVTIHTGVYFEIPRGYVGVLVPRSGKGADQGLKLRNTIGIIDSDYRGEIMAKITNTQEEPLVIQKYERFAQLLIMPVCLDDINVVTELSDTERGSGGFGSTGSRKDLKDLTIDEYDTLLKSGMLWEYYPEASGSTKVDLGA